MTRADAAVWAGAIGGAYGVERWAEGADFAALWWLLHPTVRLAEWFGGRTFELEAGRSWLCREALFEVAPACAGASFLAIAWCALAGGLVGERATTRAKLSWLPASAAIAYVVTVCANAARVAVALEAHVAGGGERLHRLIGVSAYLLFLVGAFCACSRSARGPARPVAVYLGCTLAVPVLRGSATAGLAEHALTIGFVAAVVWLALSVFVGKGGRGNRDLDRGRVGVEHE